MTDSPSPLRVGFLGLGIMGAPMASRLIGHFAQVTVWNRSVEKTTALAALGASVASSPAEVIACSDITFAMLADPSAAQAVVFSENGVLSGFRQPASAGKGYVDMSTVSAETSIEIGKAITAAGGVFLEAPVSGSKQPAIDGQLVILAAGDAALYEKSLPAFERMGKKSLLLGEVGCGARMKLVVNAVMGAMMGAFTEGMALADGAGLKQDDLLQILDLGAMSNPMFRMKGPSIKSGEFPPAFPLKHQQKDLKLALQLSEQCNQPLPVIAAANEVYKQAKAAGHGDEDFAAVYTAVKGANSGGIEGGKQGANGHVDNKLPSSNSLTRLVPDSMELVA